MVVLRRTIPLAALFLFCVDQVAAATRDEIIASYKENYEALTSVRIEYEETTRFIGPPEILYKHWKMLAPEKKQITLVCASEKIHFSTVNNAVMMDQVLGKLRVEQPNRFKDIQGDLGASVSYDEVARILPGLSPKRAERMLVYDGTLLYEKSPFAVSEFGITRRVYFISNPREKNEFLFETNLLDVTLYGFDISGLEQDSLRRAKYRLPDLFSVNDLSVTTDAEEFDGNKSVVLDAPGNLKIWLDPDHAYAVRRREVTSSGQMILRFECNDFEKVVRNIWLPRTVIATYYGDQRVPEPWRGKPMTEKRWHVTVFEANSPDHEAFFQLTPEPGSKVFDQTLKPIDLADNPVEVKPLANGIVPTVAYVQPADPENVEKVAKQARANIVTESDIGVEVGSSSLRTVFIFVNIAFLAMIVILLVRRKMAAR